MKNTTTLIMIAIIDCVIAVSGFSFFWIVETADDFHLVGTQLPYPGLVLAAASMILALVTFFGLLAASESSGRGWGLNKGGMRGAIAATILVVYYIGSAEGHEYPNLQVGDEVNPRRFLR